MQQSTDQHFSLTSYYGLLQGSFWMSHATIMGFATVYLQDKGLSNTSIGLLLALGTILSIFLQPVFGSLVDRSPKLTMLHILFICTLFIGFCGLLLQFVSFSFFAISFSFIAIVALFSSFPAFLNVVAMDYINAGRKLNFGLGRGIGSISYAFIALIMGLLVKRFGSEIIVPTFLILLLLHFIIICALEKKSPLLKWNSSSSTTSSSPSPLEGFLAFFKNYKRFSCLLIGLMFLFVGHASLNTYHINIIKNVGGDTSNMGFSFALSAAMELPSMLLFTFFISKFKCSTLLKISAFFFTMKALIIALSTQVMGIYFSQCFQFFSFAIFVPASVYYVNHLIEKRYRGMGQALLGAATVGLGGTLGNFFAGKILDLFPVQEMLIFAVIISALGFIITFFTVED